jgi:hypothetical protein
MQTTAQIAKHLREVYFGGNWTVSSLKEHITDLTWEEANTKVYTFNSITTLVYHTNYYLDVLIKFLNKQPLDAKDEYSFQHPPVLSAQDWQNLLDKTWSDAEKAAAMIEQLPDSILAENFIHKKYGIYYRNLHGIVEHMHYHLGQIVLIKKIIREKQK